MKKYFKIFKSKSYLLIIYFKNKLITTSSNFDFRETDKLLSKYSKHKKIVVLGNGPSANNMKTDPQYLYLVTNSGEKLVRELDYVYYVNDALYIQKLLSNSSFLKNGVDILFYYNDSILHKNGINFLTKYCNLLKHRNYYFISNILSNEKSNKNYSKFISFYRDRGLEVKIQNSGMFLLLFGYYMAFKLRIPMEIYGLDMGVGGKLHFDGKGLIGKSVIEERIKKNIKIYLNYFYDEYEGNIINNSFFHSNSEHETLD